MFNEIFEEAYNAATAAIKQMFDDGHREQPFNCGYAWVAISGRTSFAKFCREQNDYKFGDKGYPKGWEFWGPGDWPQNNEMGFTVYAQDMDFKLAGAKAFANVLKSHGIEAHVRSRLD